MPINAEMASNDSNVPVAAKITEIKTVKAKANAGVPPLLTVASFEENNPSRLSAKRIRGADKICTFKMPNNESKASAVIN